MACALGRFLFDIRLDGEREIVLADCGGKFEGHFDELRDCHRIKHVFVASDTPRLKGCVEHGSVLLEFTQVDTCVCVSSVFADVMMSNTTDNLWLEAINGACDSFNRTASVTKPDDNSPHECNMMNPQIFRFRPSCSKNSSTEPGLSPIPMVRWLLS